MKKKMCKNCGKELNLDHKSDLCENCSIKKTNKIKKVAKGIGSGVITLGSFAIFVATRGRKGKL